MIAIVEKGEEDEKMTREQVLDTLFEIERTAAQFAELAREYRQFTIEKEMRDPLGIVLVAMMTFMGPNNTLGNHLNKFLAFIKADQNDDESET